MKMKVRSSFVISFLLSVQSLVAVAQSTRTPPTSVDLEPPSLQRILAKADHTDNPLADILPANPELPLGPLDVLHGYESEMTLIAQRMSAELASVSQALQSNQITRDQAEYLIQERYQVAMMQHQVLSALHDSLEYYLARVTPIARRPDTAHDSDTAVVVAPPSSENLQTQ